MEYSGEAALGKDADAGAGVRMCELMPLVCVHMITFRQQRAWAWGILKR